MNRLVTCIYKTVVIISLLLATVSTAHPEGNDCSVEFFQNSGYAGPHFRLSGPIALENLNNINGENWTSRIDSIKVGTKAKLIIFDNINFQLSLKDIAKYPDFMRALGVTEQDVKEDSELILGANMKVHDLSDFGFRNKIRSLKIECIQ